MQYSLLTNADFFDKIAVQQSIVSTDFHFMTKEIRKNQQHRDC